MKTKITSNILEDISRRFKGESYSEDMSNNALIVFNGSNIQLEERIEYIKQLKKKGMKVSIAFSFMGEQLLDKEKIINSLCPINIYKEEDIFNLKNITSNYSSIIGPNITMNTLSKVALGMIDSFIPTIIWTFMYQGKNTYLDFTPVRNYLGAETENPEIKKMVENYINQVLKMGAIEINKDKYLNNIISEDSGAIIEVKESFVEEKQKKVITEKDIIKLPENKNLILPRGSIITPLAKDKAREMHIKIEIK